MKDIQKEVADWATYNFGANPIYQPTLGLTEECAEFYAARNHYTTHMGYDRTAAEEGRAKMADSLGDGAIYALNVCDKANLRFVDLYNQLVESEGADRTVSTEELLGGLGLLSQAVLKHSQGIRKVDFPKLRERVSMGVRLWIRWARFQAQLWGFDLEKVVEETWAEVSKRDWVKNPGGPAPEEQG